MKKSLILSLILIAMGAVALTIGVAAHAQLVPYNTYAITATANGSGTISPAGTVTVTSGTSETFSILPNTGYQLASLAIDGVNTSTASSYTFNDLTSNHTITATFASATSTATGTVNVVVNVENGNGGTAMPSDFMVNVSGANPSMSSFSGNASGTMFTVNANTPYLINVSSSASGIYAETSSNCDNDNVVANGSTTCTVTETYLGPSPVMTTPSSTASSTVTTMTNTTTTTTTTVAPIYVVAPTPVLTIAPNAGYLQFNGLVVDSVTTNPDGTTQIVASNPAALGVNAMSGTTSALSANQWGNCESFASADSDAGVPTSCPAEPTLTVSSSTTTGSSTMMLPEILYIPYRITVDAGTDVLQSDRTATAISHFSPDDEINVYGYYSGGGNIDAQIVRDLSIPSGATYVPPAAENITTLQTVLGALENLITQMLQQVMATNASSTASMSSTSTVTTTSTSAPMIPYVSSTSE